MNTHDDKLFAATLLVAFAGSVLAWFGSCTSPREAIAEVRNRSKRSRCLAEALRATPLAWGH